MRRVEWVQEEIDTLCQGDKEVEKTMLKKRGWESEKKKKKKEKIIKEKRPGVKKREWEKNSKTEWRWERTSEVKEN